MSFELQCRCGKTLSVTESTAGGWVRCACGQDTAVPSLRDLRAGKRPNAALPPAPEHPPVSAALAARAEPAAIDEWKLPCACGYRIRITAKQAGTWVSCVCGRSQAVPTLHRLRSNPPVEASTAFSATAPPPEIAALPETTSDATEEKVRSLIEAGASDQQILAELGSQGVTRERIAENLDDLRETHFRDYRERAKRNIVLGIVWLVLGAALTLVTYALAAIAGGGVYLVAWGAMVGGTIQLFVGLYQLIDAPSREAAHRNDEGE